MSLLRNLIVGGGIALGSVAAGDAVAQEKPIPVESSETERNPETSSIFRREVKKPAPKIIEKKGRVRTRTKYRAEEREGYGVTVSGKKDDDYGNVPLENGEGEAFTNERYTVRGYPDETVDRINVRCDDEVFGGAHKDDGDKSANLVTVDEGSCEYDFVFTRKGPKGKDIDRARTLKLTFKNDPNVEQEEEIVDPYDDYGLRLNRTGGGNVELTKHDESNTTRSADVENDSQYDIKPEHGDEDITSIDRMGCGSTDSALVRRSSLGEGELNFTTDEGACEKGCIYSVTLTRDDGQERKRRMALNFDECPEEVAPEVPVKPTNKDKKLVAVSGELGMGYSNVRHGGDSMTQEFQAYAPSALVGLYFNNKTGTFTTGFVGGYQLKHFIDGNEHGLDLGTAMEHDWMAQLGFRFGKIDGNNWRVNLGAVGRQLEQEGKDITLSRRNIGGFVDAQIDLPELLSKERFGIGADLDYQLQMLNMEASVDGKKTELGAYLGLLQQNHKLKAGVPFRFGAQGNAWKVAPGFQWDRVYDPTRQTSGGTKGLYDSFALALELGKEFSNGELELVGLMPLGKNYQAGGAARWTNADGNMAFGVEYHRGMNGTTTDHTLLGTFAIGSKDSDIYMPVRDVLRDTTPQ